MTLVVLDLEWNGAFCKKLNGYFNEIIEIGAVRLNDQLEIAERFDEVICPQVSRKLTHWVSDLTGYTDEQVRGGIRFTEAMERLGRFIGDSGETVLLTWSNTDLSVLMENCRYYYGDERIPFMNYYLDLQAYAQHRQQLGTAQQVGLGNFAELLGMDHETLELHHAIDDSVLTAQILRRVYDRPSFEAALRPTDDEFYARLRFKPSFVRELDDPAARPEYFVFRCEQCGETLKPTAPWKFLHRYFTAPLQCACGKNYVGRVQIRCFYDGPKVKRWLRPAAEPKKGDSEPAE